MARRSHYTRHRRGKRRGTRRQRGGAGGVSLPDGYTGPPTKEEIEEQLRRRSTDEEREAYVKSLGREDITYVKDQPTGEDRSSEIQELLAKIPAPAEPGVEYSIPSEISRAKRPGWYTLQPDTDRNNQYYADYMITKGDIEIHRRVYAPPGANAQDAGNFIRVKIRELLRKAKEKGVKNSVLKGLQADIELELFFRKFDKLRMANVFNRSEFMEQTREGTTVTEEERNLLNEHREYVSEQVKDTDEKLGSLRRLLLKVKTALRA